MFIRLLLLALAFCSGEVVAANPSTPDATMQSGGATTPEFAPVTMAAFRVIGSYTDVRFSVRFRYHLPGKGLKALIFAKVPQSWGAKAINKGDLLVAVDGIALEGKSIPAAAKLIDLRRGTPMIFDVQSKKTGEIRKVEVLFTKDSGDLTIQFP